MHNARDGLDIANFLAEPVKEEMEAHFANLRYVARSTIAYAA